MSMRWQVGRAMRAIKRPPAESTGDRILGLVDRFAAPQIVTFHTLLAEPSADQRRVMEHLVAKAAKLVVMSAFGRETLIRVYGAKAERIELIEHGTPDRAFAACSPIPARPRAWG